MVWNPLQETAIHTDSERANCVDSCNTIINVVEFGDLSKRNFSRKVLAQLQQIDVANRSRIDS
jgi:hypothetical protein